MSLLRGRVHKLGDRICTDVHVSARSHPLGTTREQLIAGMFHDIDPHFSEKIQKGDFIVAGDYFGTRSTFDDSIDILKAAGIAAVIAKQFGHLFFRCAVNGGLMVLTANTDEIAAGDLLTIDLTKSIITDETQGLTIAFDPLPEFLLNMLHEGGVFNHIRKHGAYVGAPQGGQRE